jgi:type II restriction enzyme
MVGKKKTPHRRQILAGTRSLAGRKVDEALALLLNAGIPVGSLTAIGKDRIALALLSIANMKPGTPWSEAAVHGDGANWKLTSRQIINFQNEFWKQRISSGSYDDIRRVDLEPLLLAGIAVASAGNPNANQNNPTRSYAVHPEAAALLQSFGSPQAPAEVARFLERMGSLEERMERRRPLKIGARLPDGKLIELAKGQHNALQKATLELFIPRFAPEAKVLYIGDASKKYLHVDAEGLASLGLNQIAHEMLPDIVLLDTKNQWLLLIEAVHSSNPVSKLRHLALEEFTAGCALPKVFVSVFATRKEFRRWVFDISWETEVWLTDSPDHLIHFNGDRYLGPHPAPEHK